MEVILSNNNDNEAIIISVLEGIGNKEVSKQHWQGAKAKNGETPAFPTAPDMIQSRVQALGTSRSVVGVIVTVK